jgi:hypothetical protein
MDENDLRTWLDTETKALFAASPPNKLAPPSLDPFSVVVLYRERSDVMRQLRAFERVLKTSSSDAERCLEKSLPFVLKSGLLHGDALLAQFELICSDIVSAFIPDTVVSDAEPQYLASLYNRLIRSPEFALVKACLKALPADDRGTRFVDQFIGEKPVQLPFQFVATNKKCRIMQQWAANIGGVVEVDC